MNRHVTAGIERLRTYWPQSHAVPSKSGACLIVVPSVLLPKHFRENICTVLFVTSPGFPAARPDHFFTDIEVRMANLAMPHNTVTFGDGRYGYMPGYRPQWSTAMWWSWHLQMWDPNRSTLMSFMNAIKTRFCIER